MVCPVFADTLLDRQAQQMELTLLLPESGSVEELVVQAHDPTKKSTITHSTRDFAGVVYLLWWAADAMADPILQPVVKVTCARGHEAAAEWFDGVFQRNCGPFAGARDLLEATDLIESSRLLPWML